MPKKNRKTKKKSSVVLNTEINIVDEGQSSLDVSDVIRREKEIEAKKAENPVIEIGVEAEEPGEVLNVEANNFSVTEVASLRKVDSLAVAGRQGSINSNFSFFSETGHDRTSYPNVLSAVNDPNFRKLFHFFGVIVGKALYEGVLLKVRLEENILST